MGLSRGPTPGALPNLVVIGTMKAGTSALHHYLGLHPEIAMSEPKELNFFFGTPPERGDVSPRACEGESGAAPWSRGNWHRGLDWYARHFSAGFAVRGESSPGYTSPGREVVVERMASVLPGARIVYLVRDPVRRAISQYGHHLREGTERRPPAEALLDPHSHYIQRSRYFERLRPFLEVFPADRIAILSTEELLSHRRATLRSIFDFLGVDDTFWCSELDRRSGSYSADLEIDVSVQRSLRDAVIDDADKLRGYAGRSFGDWSV